MNITNTLLFLVEKNVRILCIAKDSHILSTKNNSAFADVVSIYLTIGCLNDDVKLTKFEQLAPYRQFLHCVPFSQHVIVNHSQFH